MEFEAVIGLETHVQLSTKSKIFCGCSTAFGAPPNANTCPVCLGMPGVLPVLNADVLRRAVMVGLATGCRIAARTKFDRKNYFYPDLPKGYQISQYDMPIATGGAITITMDDAEKVIGLTRVHMEEDAGKLIHGENLGHPDSSYVDLNRAGVPLLEIVSEPDIRSAEEAKKYLEKLKAILEYLDVSDCNMEEGSLRCDANVSIRPKGQKEFGTRAEVKNMNSFRFLQRAIEFEIARQIQVVKDGGRVIQETRLYDSARDVTISMRGKEEAHDYRYFPEPDLPLFTVSPEYIATVRASLPELPDDKRRRFESKYTLPRYDAEVLTASREMADWYEEAVRVGQMQRTGHVYASGTAIYPKVVSNWAMGDVRRILNQYHLTPSQSRVTPTMLVEMIALIDEGVISGKIAKTVFEEMANSGKAPRAIVAEQGLTQITDTSAIEAEVDKIIAANPDQVASFKAGKDKVLGWFVGQVMRATKGKASPDVVNEILKKKLT